MIHKKKFRISGTKYTISSITNHKRIIDGCETDCITNIYSAKVNSFTPVSDTDYVPITKKMTTIKTNNITGYVGYVIWGKLKDCMECMSKIETSKQVRSNVIGVSIISISKTIEMIEYALKKQSNVDIIESMLYKI